MLAVGAASSDGGCRKRRSSVVAALPLAVVRSASTRRPHGAYPICGHAPAAFLLRDSRHVTTVCARGRSPAVRQPFYDACPTCCQIQAWVSSSHPRVSVALRPFAGPAHSGRHRKPASDRPGAVPARPISPFRRVYRIADPRYPARRRRVACSERAVRFPLTVPDRSVPRSDHGRSTHGHSERGARKAAFGQARVAELG